MSMRSLLMGGNNTAPSTAAARYTSPSATQGAAWATTDAAQHTVMPESCEVSELFVQITNAPGAGASWVFTVYKNNSATALTCTISGASATSAIDSSNAVVFAAGDTISLQSLPSVGTVPAAAGVNNFYMIATAADAILLAQNNTSMATSGTQFMNPIGSQNATWETTTEANVSMVVPFAGSVKGFWVELTGAPSGAASYTFTLMKNGSTTLSVAAIVGSATTAHDILDVISYAAGDTMSVQVVPALTPTARGAHWGIAFAPTVLGDSFIGFSNSQSPSTSATNYNQVNGQGGPGWTATEANVQMVVPACTIGPFYVNCTTAPGSGKSYAYTLRRDKTTTLNTVTIQDTGVSGSSSTKTAVANNTLLEIKAVPTGTPTAPAGVHTGIGIHLSDIEATHGLLALLGVG